MNAYCELKQDVVYKLLMFKINFKYSDISRFHYPCGCDLLTGWGGRGGGSGGYGGGSYGGGSGGGYGGGYGGSSGGGGYSGDSGKFILMLYFLK